mmetsp:Transcript_139/g.419  ORF Transcript_139/g.419 Transcript_139/m.419 type:complete len:233 (-) Transcript_139:48-746(-)
MLDVLVAKTVVDLQSKQGASEGNSKERRKRTCHAAQSVFAHHVLDRLLEEVSADPAGYGCTDGHEGGLRTQACACENGALRGHKHRWRVSHVDVPQLMHALHCIREVSGKPELHDRKTDKEGKEQAHDGNPQPVQRLGPCGVVLDHCSWQRLPEELEKHLQQGVVQPCRHSADHADDDCNHQRHGHAARVDIFQVVEKCIQPKALVKLRSAARRIADLLRLWQQVLSLAHLL